MSYTSNIGGKLILTAKGSIKTYAKENIEINSAKTIKITGKENGISFGEPENPPILKLENGVDIFVAFKPLVTYDGEFGFDWLEWDEKDTITKVQDVDISNFEYLYDNSKNEYVAVSTNVDLKNKIKEEYKKHQVNYPYYVPWLNLFPEQGEIKLNMLIKSIITGEDVSKEVITFEKNDFYQVTIDGLVNENIKYIPNGEPKEIAIKCLKPSVEMDIVAKNEKGNIIGKIRVKDNTNTYNLPVRLVCVVKDTPNKETEIAQLITDFKTEKIEDYLNKNSLNQALIKTTVETDRKYRIAFDETAWAGTFYDKTNNWFTNRKDPAGGKVSYIDDDGVEKKDKEYEHILDKFLRDYKTIFETDGKKFKGILLFITNIKKDSNDKEGGVSRTQPVNFREAIVFAPNLKDKSTYAHEIAHALGLEHTFWKDTDGATYDPTELAKNERNLNELKNGISFNENNKQKNIDAKKSNDENIKKNAAVKKYYEDLIKTNKAEINKWTAEIKKPTYPYKKEAQLRINDLEARNIKNKATNDEIDEITKNNNKSNIDIKKYNEDIDKSLKIQKDNLDVYKSNKFKFIKKSTLNIMDYSSKTKNYSQWQWKIMQNDLKAYYGSVTENR